MWGTSSVTKQCHAIDQSITSTKHMMREKPSLRMKLTPMLHQVRTALPKGHIRTRDPLPLWVGLSPDAPCKCGFDAKVESKFLYQCSGKGF